MAKKWYPVVDILSCIECGTCVNFCSHGVYDKKTVPSPIVINPDGCIDHCHGCGNKCPVGAITYVGDDTGWIPPVLRDKGGMPDVTPSCGCGCGCAAEPETVSNSKRLLIEYLYLDLNTCDRCIGTNDVLKEVVDTLRPVLDMAGYEVNYKECEMTTIQMAEQYHFLSSPTIRVNGQDIFGDIKESDCGCCGDIAGTNIDCRVFEYDGKTYEVPTKEMLADAILKTLYTPSACACTPYVMPENLKRFYEGKNTSGKRVKATHNIIRIVNIFAQALRAEATDIFFLFLFINPKSESLFEHCIYPSDKLLIINCSDIVFQIFFIDRLNLLQQHH